MRVALAQINPVLGDFARNADKIIDYCRRAREKRADIVVFSELSLFGYPPNDLIERRDVVLEQIKFMKKVNSQIPKGIAAIYGALGLNPKAKMGGKAYQNLAVVARKGKKPLLFAKQLLPSYDIFDETRFFEPGEATGIFSLEGKGRIAISVCEDMWAEIEDCGNRIYSKNPLSGLKKIDLMVNISASPFSKTKMASRLMVAKNHVRRAKVPMVYVNQVGGQDELIFDGRSFILDEKGKIIVQAACADEDLVIVDLASRRSEYRPPEESETEILRKNLVLGIRDYILKTGQKDVHLGLSGGVDSALVAALAVDALGPSHVVGLLMPGPYSSEGSVTDSIKLAENLGIKTLNVGINQLYEMSLKTAGGFSVSSEKNGGVGIMEQNLQARLRGLMLMAYSNATGSMLLSTSNKSELATGYSTLYGDTNGGLMPIGDLLKGEIYTLAEHYNSSREIIPEEILMKPPSAELAPQQVDEDSLPPYPELDKAVAKIVENKKSATTSIDKWLLKQLARNEFKRWQAPPILRVSEHGFGRGRRFPIAQKAF